MVFLFEVIAILKILTTKPNYIIRIEYIGEKFPLQIIISELIKLYIL